MAKLSNLLSKISENEKLDVVGKRNIWFIVPAFIIVLAVILFFTVGMNVGIDFSGGIKIELYKDGAGITDAEYNTFVSEITEVVNANDGVVSYAQRSGDGCVVIKCSSVNASPSDDELLALQSSIESDLLDKYSDLLSDEDNYLTVSFSGAAVSTELLSRALVAVGVASVLMLVYIWIRFDLFSGLSAVITLLHDVIITFALTVIFRVQINSSYIAAIITIIAYSINATIILFDRAREIKKQTAHSERFNPTAIANRSVRETLTRSLFTNVTTIIPIALLAIFSVATIQEFALPIIFGLLAGLFSSVCLAPSFWTMMHNAKLKRKKA